MSAISTSSSPLSSPAFTDEDVAPQMSQERGISKFLEKHAPALKVKETEPPRTRPASPPHEYVLADNPDIPFIVMFRARFYEVFQKSVPSFGPQDIERGVAESAPSVQVEDLLCALLGLVLNRKKPPERGHYQRALEEAVHTHASQWPRTWKKKNILHGGNTFANMTPSERLNLLKTLILWALSSSEAVQAMIRQSYKQTRREDDINQPLSVQPWGQDGEKRRYWLIQGRDDTEFRLYRESNPKLKTNTWWSIAGNIEELKAVSKQLSEGTSQAARRLSEKINVAIPNLEAAQERIKRREYRLARKAQFAKPEPGFSLYEGRTRGKKQKYTFSSEEDEVSDQTGTRRSNRQLGRSASPAKPLGPVFTASGRQVRPRRADFDGGPMYNGHQNGNMEIVVYTGEGTMNAEENMPQKDTRSRRSGVRDSSSKWSGGGDHIPGYNIVDEMDEEEDATSSGEGEYAGDNDDEHVPGDESADDDMDFEMSDADDLSLGQSQSRSLVVRLRVPNMQQTEDRPQPHTHNGVQHHRTGGTHATNLPILSNGKNPSSPLKEAAKSMPSQAIEQAPHAQEQTQNSFNGTATKPTEQASLFSAGKDTLLPPLA